MDRSRVLVRPASAVDTPRDPASTSSRRWSTQFSATLRAHTQADYNSNYSLEKALCLFHFRQARWRRVARLLLTPWGCLVVSLLSELLPLEDPSRGWRACLHFHVRLFVRTTVFNASVAVVSQETIPELALAPLELLGHSAIQALAFVGALILYAHVFRVFPVPFSFNVVAPVLFVALWITRLRFFRVVLRSQKDADATHQLRHRFIQLVRLNGIGPLILIGYAAFAGLFQHVNDRVQLALAVLLQLLKLGAKRATWAHAQLWSGGDDLAGEHVTSSAHFFHALFTATSVQSSKSTLTLTLLVGWNMVYDVIAIRDLVTKSDAVERAWHCIPAEARADGRRCCMRRAARHLGSATDLGFAVVSSYARHHREAQRVLLTVDTERSTSTNDYEAERAWLCAATHLYHWRETVLLRLYVDVFVPIIYCLFVSALATLLNGQYYPYMRDVDMALLGPRVAVQVASKVVMLGLLLWFVRRKDADPDEPSALDHLSFLLHAQRFTLVPKLLIIGLTVLDFPLVHLGNDVSFRFEWIRG